MAVAGRLTPSKNELLDQARRGDVASLGLLLEQHRVGLRWTILATLGHRNRDQVEDIVQETFLRALSKLDQLEHADAFGGWLHAIARNTCLQYLRSHRPSLPSADLTEFALESDLVESAIVARELRDHVWAAISLIPEHLQETVMLRYFGSTNSYHEIAAALRVPIGTVRSRLHQARAALGVALVAAARSHTDGSLDRRAQEIGATLSAVHETDARDFIDMFEEDVLVDFAGGSRVAGRWALEVDMRDTVDAGVRISVQEAMFSGSVSVLDATLANPPDDPLHCPPEGTMVLSQLRHRFGRLRMYMASHPAGEVPLA